jgi:hypothetical protein
VSEKTWGEFAAGPLGGGAWFKLSIWSAGNLSAAQLARLIEKLKMDLSFAQEDEIGREMVEGDL